MTGPGRVGRPRSEEARTAVLHAVDDLLLDVGYTAMTMKGIAERAGVSRMTVYRWWATKAEIIVEASALDAEKELTIVPTDDPRRDVTTYVTALVGFLAQSPAGVAYRVLLGEAQHDPAVAELLEGQDPLGDTARVVVQRVLGDGPGVPPVDEATALLIGPAFFWITTGRDPARLVPQELADTFLRQVGAT